MLRNAEGIDSSLAHPCSLVFHTYFYKKNPSQSSLWWMFSFIFNLVWKYCHFERKIIFLQITMHCQNSP